MRRDDYYPFLTSMEQERENPREKVSINILDVYDTIGKVKQRTKDD